MPLVADVSNGSDLVTKVNAIQDLVDTALQPADVGSAAAAATGDFATAAQGALADTALQPLAGVVTATGTLTVATHSGQYVVTSGNVVIPHASGSKGFNCVLIAGGAHTVTFHNGTNPITSAAMAAGDMMTVFVQDDATGTPTIRLRLSPAAEQVALT